MQDIPCIVDEFDGYWFLVRFCIVVSSWLSFMCYAVGCSFYVVRKIVSGSACDRSETICRLPSDCEASHGGLMSLVQGFSVLASVVWKQSSLVLCQELDGS